MIRIWRLLSLLVALASVAFLQGCEPEGDIGFFLFYEDANFGGRSFLGGFNRSYGSAKWDLYDFQSEVGNDRISSLKVFVTRPMAVYLCENTHFRGRYCKFIVPPNQWFEIPNLASVNFNDLTSSVIATNEGPAVSFRRRTPLGFNEAVEMFRDSVRVKILRKSSVEAVEMWRTQVFWDTGLNVLIRDAFDRDNASYSPAFEGLKDTDLIQFYQNLDLDPEWWAWNYEVQLRYWIQPTWDGGNMGFRGWAWEYWVEGGLISGTIAEAIEPDMPGQLDSLAAVVDQTVRARMDVVGVALNEPGLTRELTTGLGGISFTLPDPSDAAACNTRAGSGVGCGFVESSPPTVILHQDSE